jgi:hypothetical protein
MQTHLSGRFRESAELARHLRQLSDDPFYVIAHHSMLVWDRLAQGDLDGAGHSLAEARKDEDRTGNLDGLEALIAVRSGRTEEARRLLASCEGRRTLLAGSLMSAAGAALRLGEGDVAIRLMTREIVRELGPVLVRLDPELHPLLDRAPFSPRRSALSLVWPLQSPMIDPARHGLFHEVRIESAVPRPGGVLP